MLTSTWHSFLSVITAGSEEHLQGHLLEAQWLSSSLLPQAIELCSVEVFALPILTEQNARSSIRGRRRRTQRTFWTSLQWTGLLPMAASTHRSTSSPLQVACKYAAFYAINRDVMTRSQLDQFQNRSLALKSFDTISITDTIPCMAQLLSSALSPFCCRLRPQCRPFDWGFPGANEGVWAPRAWVSASGLEGLGRLNVHLRLCLWAFWLSPVSLSKLQSSSAYSLFLISKTGYMWFYCPAVRGVYHQ